MSHDFSKEVTEALDATSQAKSPATAVKKTTSPQQSVYKNGQSVIGIALEKAMLAAAAKAAAFKNTSAAASK